MPAACAAPHGCGTEGWTNVVGLRWTAADTNLPAYGHGCHRWKLLQNDPFASTLVVRLGRVAKRPDLGLCPNSSVAFFWPGARPCTSVTSMNLALLMCLATLPISFSLDSRYPSGTGGPPIWKSLISSPGLVSPRRKYIQPGCCARFESNGKFRTSQTWILLRVELPFSGTALPNCCVYRRAGISSPTIRPRRISSTRLLTSTLRRPSD